MLERTSISVVGAPPQPTCLTGKSLARNRQSPEARVALVLRMVGGEAVSDFSTSQACRLARPPGRWYISDRKSTDPSDNGLT